MIDDAPREALELLAEGFHAIWVEMHQAEDCQPPTPDDLQGILDEHAAMKATLARLREMQTPEQNAALFNLYRDERKTAHGYYDMPSMYFLPEVKALAEQVLEGLRRLASFDSELTAIFDRHDMRRPA